MRETSSGAQGMTPAEIKKAWNKLKRAIKNEVSFSVSGSFYMTAKQIENRTATVALCNGFSYDYEISRCKECIDTVKSLLERGLRSKEEADESIADYQDDIDYYSNQKKKYGSKDNEARVKADEILNAEAYKKFAEAVGVKGSAVEYNKSANMYYLRLYY